MENVSKGIIFILFGLFVCFVGTGVSAAKITLKYGEIETPETFEPITATKMVEFRLCQLVFEGLV